MLIQRWSNGPLQKSPGTHHDLAFGTRTRYQLGPISPSVAGAITRVTRQAGANMVISAPYAWVYDVELFCEKWVTSTGTDPSLTLDVVVAGNALSGQGAGYGATAGNPFANPNTDFASLLTAAVNAFGTTSPTLFNAAYNANATFNHGYMSARLTANPPILPRMADITETSIQASSWGSANLKNQGSETMQPMLLRGMELGLRLITAAGGAGNTVTGLSAIVTLVESDTPFDW